MEVLIFAAARFLKDKSSLSEAIWVSRSIVAGSPRGVSLAKVFSPPNPTASAHHITDGWTLDIRR
eukprot:1287489-Pyramimonas_sp.AAC.1